MKVFITGGAGFIGSHLCARFLKERHQVIAYDNLILGRREHLFQFSKDANFHFIEADLLDLARVRQEMTGADLVVHMAANSDISQGAARTDVDMQNGTVATYNVLESMRLTETKQILFASTSAIYGEASVKPTPESYGPLLPISFYGASKLACEAMISAFAHNCGFQAWIYRFANIVGPSSTHGAIHDFVARLIKEPNVLNVLGNGTQRKSYLHVTDCVDGMLYGYQKLKGELSCVNLASHGVTNVRFIAEEVARQMGKAMRTSPRVVFGEGDKGWVGDVSYTHLDGALFAQSGWKARLDSDAAVCQAIREVIHEKLAQAGSAT